MKGGGCYKCPVKGCRASYRGSHCSHLRELAGVNTDPKTIGDLMREADDEQLAKIISIFQQQIVCLFTGISTSSSEERIKELVELLRQPAKED